MILFNLFNLFKLFLVPGTDSICRLILLEAFKLIKLFPSPSTDLSRDDYVFRVHCGFPDKGAMGMAEGT
jgi:hypothetical protein